jgi:hypothetical protein
MKDWGFTQNHPNEELSRVHLFSRAECARAIDRFPSEGK